MRKSNNNEGKYILTSNEKNTMSGKRMLGKKPKKKKKVVYTVLHMYRWELGRRRVLSEVRFFIHVKDS